jgi:hypothetical protein
MSGIRFNLKGIPVKFYLASRYGRRDELRGYAALLTHQGHEVTSRWLTGEHESNELMASDEEKRRWATEDLCDLLAADWFVFFSESGIQAGSARGGRNVEFGYALGAAKNIVVVGEPENIFHCLAKWFVLTPEGLIRFAAGLPI